MALKDFATPIAAGIGAVSSAFGQRSANKQNLKIAREQMAFTERLSSSAHQREVKDLRLAGLNPILSATGGSGASTPAGASARMENAAPDLTNTVATALASKRLRADLGLIEASTYKTEQEGQTEIIKKAEAIARIAEIVQRTKVLSNTADVTSIPAKAATTAKQVLTHGVRVGGEGGFSDKASTLINDIIDIATRNKHGPGQRDIRINYKNPKTNKAQQQKTLREKSAAALKARRKRTQSRSYNR